MSTYTNTPNQFYPLTNPIPTGTIIELQRIFQEVIGVVGTNVSYSQRYENRGVVYGQQVVTYTSLGLVNCAISVINGEDKFQLQKQGFTPVFDAKLWLYSVVPSVGDRVTDPANLTYEVRGVYPRVLLNNIVFFECEAVRIISTETINSK